MKVALISDLHANYEAARALTDDLSEVDFVICMGDLLGYYCQVNEIMDWVRAHVSVCVMGNHDWFVLKGCPEDVPPAVEFGVEHAAGILDPDHARWLGQLPLVWGGELAGRTLFVAHGSPWNPLEDYLYADSPRLAGLDEFNFDLMAFGQTHRYYSRRDGAKLVINPGAVGQSRDPATLGRATAAIVDLTTMEITRQIRPYDVEKVIRLARRQGADEWIQKFLMP